MEQKTTREVTQGIYKTIPTGLTTSRTQKIGERTKTYIYTTDENNSYIIINGAKYKVKENREFAIKIQRTQIQAKDGAKGLLKFLTEQSDCMDNWEIKILTNCRPFQGTPTQCEIQTYMH